jgi:hypothetical protein
VSALRSWIALLALVSFLAGLASGLLVAERRAVPEAPRGAFVDYQRMFSDRFELGAERQRILGGLLRSYQEDIARIRDRHTAEYLSAMEPELRDSGLRYRNIIRNELLPEEDRAEFDRLERDYVVSL